MMRGAYQRRETRFVTDRRKIGDNRKSRIITDRLMPRLSRSLLALALFAMASFARADAPRLIAPARGTTLRGGAFAEIRWSAAELPASAEEWEAFLSIDGGAYYAFRITPHLDADLRHFTFIVPNVETHDARILIRTGDEVHETHFETPGTFSIARDAHAQQDVLRLLPVVGKTARGEAARDGDPAVVAWTEGARNGSGVAQQSAAPVHSSSFSSIAVIPADAAPFLAPAVTSAVAPTIATILRSMRDEDARKAEPLPITADLLLVCRRLNI
jgi:hypothetical protein